MSETTQRQVDAGIEQSMDLFKRADVGEVTSIDPNAPETVLVALDGSTQDIATVTLAQRLVKRLACKAAYVFVPAAIENKLDAEVAVLLESLPASEIVVQPDDNYSQILAAIKSSGADLLLAPCPFGRDFESLGEDSIGTVIDVLTARSTIPFIAIRRPDATGSDPCQHVRLILTGENPAADVAAQRAVGLVQPGGKLDLLLLVEESFYENFRGTLQALDPNTEVTYEHLENALATKYGRLNAALQRTAASVGFTYELLIRHEGDDKPITPEDPVTHPALMVLALERGEHDSQGEITDFIRRSPHAVLVVSVE